MKANTEFLTLIEKVQSGHQMNTKEVAYLLSFDETSLEAGIIRAVADYETRQKFGNKGLVFGQIGFEIAPCPGRCQFCSFSEEFTSFAPFNMTDEALLAAADDFTAGGDLFALSLMAMHNYKFERVLDVVQKVRARIPQQTQIIINLGDFPLEHAKALKEAGANACYHLVRLGEGRDTIFTPATRMRSMQNVKDAGLDLYYCCEPVGPEHTPDEMAEQILLGLEFECFQHGAMRRVYLPHSPLAKYGQISELRLAQICGVVALAALPVDSVKTLGIHEPNLLGLTAGANAIYAETGANPRDTEAETTGHRGLTIQDCKTMLTESGFIL